MQVKQCEEIAKQIRIDAIRLTHNMGHVGAHIGGGLSLAEIMAVLYGCVMNITPQNVQSEGRNRLIFSKGHGTLALYPAMKYAGLVTDEELETYKQTDTFLYAHPCMNAEKGIEFSSGSLGQGLSLGVGVSLALKRKNNLTSKIYVILGDGECNEGSIWEAAQSAAHYHCSNLVAIVDKNSIQYDGLTSDIMDDSPLADKWRSFGWEVRECDGHSVKELIDVLTPGSEKPLVILANTIKGKGVSFMEGNPAWHNHSLSDKQYELALEELNGKEVEG